MSSSYHHDDNDDNDNNIDDGEEFNEETCVYLDYNATTPVDPWVVGMPWSKFGNPSSSHRFGREAKQAMNEARANIVKLIGASENSEIVFTSCGSESNNLALCGVVMRQPNEKRHIVTSAFEHPAVSEVCSFLAREHGARVTVVPVDQQGFVDVEEVKRAFTDDTCLCTIMLANNEVGTIQPIAEIGRFARARGVVMHTDAAQAVGKIAVNVEQLNVDLLTIVGHKMYAPKGIGALYVRKGLQLKKQQHGASHENGRRAGTENVPYIVGLGIAAQIAKRVVEPESILAMESLRELLFHKLTKELGNEIVHRNGGRPRVDDGVDDVLPNTLSVAFRGINAVDLLNELQSTVAASAGAACHSSTDNVFSVSSVLKAMQVSERDALGTLRLSLGRFTTVEEIDLASSRIVDAVKRQLLRNSILSTKK